MDPRQEKSQETAQTEAANVQEQLGEGLGDAPRPAAQVLIEQEHSRETGDRAPLYIP